VRADHQQAATEPQAAHPVSALLSLRTEVVAVSDLARRHSLVAQVVLRPLAILRYKGVTAIKEMLTLVALEGHPILGAAEAA